MKVFSRFGHQRDRRSRFLCRQMGALGGNEWHAHASRQCLGVLVARHRFLTAIVHLQAGRMSEAHFNRSRLAQSSSNLHVQFILCALMAKRCRHMFLERNQRTCT